MWWLALSEEATESPMITITKSETSSSVAVSCGSRWRKRMQPSVARIVPGDDHQPEHEQRVGEDRADQRGLRDDELAGAEREEDDEELGQVAERRLQEAGDRRPEPQPDLLGRERHHPGEPGERQRSRPRRRPPAVALE